MRLPSQSRPVARHAGISLDRSAALSPSGSVECSICYAGCELISNPIAKQLCYVACQNTVC